MNELAMPLNLQQSSTNIITLLSRIKAFFPLFLGITALIMAQIAGITLWLGLEIFWTPSILVLLLTLGNLTLSLASWYVYYGLLQPLLILEQKIEGTCSIGLKQHLRADQVGGLGEFAEAIQNLNDELADMYEDMDGRVAQQTKRLAQKTASLKILYEAAVSINQVQDLTQLLTRYLRMLKEMVNGHSATLRLVTTDGHSHLLACIDGNNRVFLEHELLPIPLCKCGQVLIPGASLCRGNVNLCSSRFKQPMYSAKESEILEVPLQYHHERLGSYHILVNSAGAAGREDMRDILVTIGRHLGIAIAKQRSDAEARRLSIVEERNHLAHELHDSLAQTLASLRFRVRLLQETLNKNASDDSTIQEVQRIKESLEEAHTELRDLLNNYRTPPDQGGLIPALEKLIAKFQQETGVAVFLQRDCHRLQLTNNEETQMLRVVQESLTNIRKHAQAHTVRVLLRCQIPGDYLLLVEDDGLGFQRSPTEVNSSGEHLGLAIMVERARRIGATVRIESEPGEGTRVEFVFKPGRRTTSILAAPTSHAH